MKIGRYQLENLVREGVRFIFADLRSETERASYADPILARAIPLSLAELKSNLATNHVPHDSPILLLSQDGQAATSAALELEADGYKNVYTVRDGIRGLQA